MQTIEVKDLANVTGGCAKQQAAPQAPPEQPQGAPAGAAPAGGAPQAGGGFLGQLLGFLQSDGLKQILGGIQSLIGQGGQSAAPPAAAAGQ